MNITGEDDRRGWRADYYDRWYNVPPSGIFSGLDDDDWESLLADQAADLNPEAEILAYCKSIGNDLYDDLRSDYEATTAYDAFEEYCEWNDVTFEVEDEDEVRCIN